MQNLPGLNTIASYMGPLLITHFVNFLTGDRDDSSRHYGLILALLFFLAKTLESLSQRQWYFGANRIGIRARAALTVLTYKKCLCVRSYGLNDGNIVNIINVDIERIGDFFWYVHGIWLFPVQVFLALGILFKNLGGAPAMAALLVTILVIVSNTPLANLQQRIHAKIMEAKDSRIKATSEALKSMRVLKLHSWDTSFLENIMSLREIEKNCLKSYSYVSAAVASLFWTSPTLVSLATFGVCIAVKTPLTSATVLSALATFRILQEPIYNLPELISMIAQTKVSIDRIKKFAADEDPRQLLPNDAPQVPDISIQIETGEYTWETINPHLKLPSIRITKKLEIKRGDKVAICGSVGSGKSSMLSSILGEIPRISGLRIKVFGSKAYAPQSAWIQTGTVQDNILFGKQMNKGFYKDVLDGCALNKDIDMWDNGDLTVIGERGMNLSGGQKQRIQLARAIYSDSDVCLLDDPFSAVDAHTGAHLFKECITRLLREKTVIYVTHQLELFDASDLVLVMEDGKIVQCGKYEDLVTNPGDEFVRQMTAHRKSLSQVTAPYYCNIEVPKPNKMDETEVTEEKPDSFNKCGKLTDDAEEETETGRVKWRVYSYFLTSAYKGALIPVIILCQVLFQGLQMGSNYWIAWATETEERVSKAKLIGVFALLSGGSSVFILGRAFLLATVSIETAHRLFVQMINCVFRAPISFFDSTPSSQILNRSSTDQSSVDMDIPYRLGGLAFALIQLMSIIILMSQVAWQVIFLFVVVVAISIWYQAYYISAARELARMVGVWKSPILHHFSESIAGAVPIRCFNQEDRFLATNINLIDNYCRLAFHNCATMEWLCVRINFLFNLVFFLVLVILVNLPKEAISSSKQFPQVTLEQMNDKVHIKTSTNYFSDAFPGLAGLAATYGLNLNVLQAWVIWNLCNVENKMISVERILQFSNITSEAPLEVEECKPKPEWPTKGTIEINNLHVQYNLSLPMVLKGVSCTFPGGCKIGVVGRTGSGKSTLIQALFRMVEPLQGTITIDGEDIGSMGLHDLRSRLSIIPQDPTLFRGTLRTNLDPLSEHSDSELWEVIRKCHLEGIVKQDQRLLDAP
ncbi:hypothetical protein MKW94_014464, partial [Papaver nudicaule]|nr:hypothetical protein [Papaver nudicaule]